MRNEMFGVIVKKGSRAMVHGCNHYPIYEGRNAADRYSYVEQIYQICPHMRDDVELFSSVMGEIMRRIAVCSGCIIDKVFEFIRTRPGNYVAEVGLAYQHLDPDEFEPQFKDLMEQIGLPMASQDWHLANKPLQQGDWVTLDGAHYGTGILSFIKFAMNVRYSEAILVAGDIVGLSLDDEEFMRELEVSVVGCCH